MNNFNLAQITFFNYLTSSNFKTRVLQLSKNLGLDGAFYFALGEKQSETKNFSFDSLDEEQQEAFIESLIIEIPEIEF